MSKLTSHQEKETEILANRIMPKTDFQKVIEHDKVYYNALNQAVEFNIIKFGLLAKECNQILAKQTEKVIIDNIDKLCEWSEAELKILDMQGKLRIQKKLVEDKETHFENVFMPQFKKEVEETNAHFDEVLNKSRELIALKEKDLESITEKMVYELSWWDKVNKPTQKVDEYRIQIYKPLKRLISAYDKKKEDLAEENKYKV